MKSRLLQTGPDGGRIFILVFDEGDEAIEGLRTFAADNGITGASVSAIGALSAGSVAWLNWETKHYEPTAIDEQCEVVSMLGDIGTDEGGKPALHLHGAVAIKGGTTFGGHFQSAHVRPTLEVTIIETPAHLVRTKRPELGGMLLIDLDQTEAAGATPPRRKAGAQLGNAGNEAMTPITWAMPTGPRPSPGWSRKRMSIRFSRASP